jgi:hypothetical protein
MSPENVETCGRHMKPSGAAIRTRSRGFTIPPLSGRPAPRNPDGRVFITTRYTGRGRVSGMDMDWRQSVVYTVEAGLIVRGEEYFDRDRGLEAAGLRE